MKQNSIDEEIVAALNFSNFVLLDQCFSEINYSLISSKSETKKKEKENGKLKFEKVSKRKQNVIENSSKVENITLGLTKKKIYDEDETFSKVKIFADEYDIFSKASLNDNVSNNVYTPSKVDEYSLSDFINQTSISSSKNKFSPINAWKASSAEKYHSNNFQISANSSYNFLLTPNPSSSNEFIFDNFAKKSPKKVEVEKASSSTKSVSKKGKKFEKCISKKKEPKEPQEEEIKTLSFTTELKSQEGLKSQPTNSSPIYVPSYQKEQLPYKQLSKESENSEQSFYDNETRDTCELAPSKLEKLIEVEDNKYKEMVLKTYYKHQK